MHNGLCMMLHIDISKVRSTRFPYDWCISLEHRHAQCVLKKRWHADDNPSQFLAEDEKQCSSAPHTTILECIYERGICQVLLKFHCPILILCSCLRVQQHHWTVRMRSSQHDVRAKCDSTNWSQIEIGCGKNKMSFGGARLEDIRTKNKCLRVIKYLNTRSLHMSTGLLVGLGWAL